MADSVRTKVLEILIRAQNTAAAAMADAAAQVDALGKQAADASKYVLGLGDAETAAGDSATRLGEQSSIAARQMSLVADSAAVAGAKASSAAASLHSVGIGLIGAGAAAGVVIGVSAKAAVEFQQMTQQIADNTTLGAAGLATMRTAILAMSAAGGAPLQDLATGFMHISNMGYSATQSIAILQQAMMSAVSTGSNTGDVANALALQMHDFGMNAGQAARAMDVLHLAAAMGNATLEEYATGTSKAISTAANLGLSFTQVDAALSALSRHMSVTQASTMLAGMLQKISGPSVSAEAELKKLSATSGINLVADFSAAGLKARGLAGVLVDLANATKGNYTEIQKLIPATRGGMAAFVLNGSAAKDYTSILAALTATMAGQSAPTQQAYAAYLLTTAGSFQRLQAATKVVEIELGTAFLPVLTRIAAGVLPVVLSLSNWVSKHVELTKTVLLTVAALGVLSAAILGVEFVLAPLEGLIGAISLPVAALAAAGFGLYEAWQHDFGGIREIAQAAWHGIQPVFAAMGGAITSLRQAFASGGLGGAFADLPRALGAMGTAFEQAFTKVNWPRVGANLLHGLNDLFHTMETWIQNTGVPFFTDRLRAIGDAFTHIDWKKIGSDLLAALGHLKDDLLAIDWKGVAKTIGDALGALGTDIGKINWGAIGSAIVSALSGLKRDIQAIDWRKLGSDLVSALSNLKNDIASLNWKGFGSAVLTALRTLKNDITGIDWSGIWSTVKASFTGVIRWFTGLNWGGWAGDAKTGIKNAIGTVAAWIGGTTVWHAVEAGFSSILTWLTTTNWLSWSVHALADLKSGVATIGNWIGGTSVWHLLKDSFTTIIAWITGLDWSGWGQDAINGLKTALGTVTSWIGTKASSLGTALRQWSAAFGSWVLGSGWPDLLKALGTLLQNFNGWIDRQPDIIATHLSSWAAKFGEWVMNKGWPALHAGLVSLGEKLGEWIVLTSPPSIALHLAVWAAKFGEWVMSKGWPALKTALGHLLTSFTGWITGDAPKQITKAALLWPPAIVAAFTGATVAGVSAASALLVGVGTSIIQGLIQGMTKETSQLLGEVDKLLGTDIKGPFDGLTTWFADLGTNIMNALMGSIKKLGAQLASIVQHDITGVLKSIPGVSLLGNLSLTYTGQPTAPGAGASLMNYSVPTTNNLLPGAANPNGVGTVNQSFTISVNVNGAQVTTTGDRMGIGKLIGQAVVESMRTLEQSIKSSNGVAGSTALAGAI